MKKSFNHHSCRVFVTNSLGNSALATLTLVVDLSEEVTGEFRSDIFDDTDANPSTDGTNESAQDTTEVLLWINYM
jgi:hypothetical protein